MTLYELAERDLQKAKISLVHARQKPNVTEAEIENLEKLVALRTELFNLVGGNNT